VRRWWKERWRAGESARRGSQRQQQQSAFGSGGCCGRALALHRQCQILLQVLIPKQLGLGFNKTSQQLLALELVY
jgi:hypothetical protein